MTPDTLLKANNLTDKIKQGTKDLSHIHGIGNRDSCQLYIPINFLNQEDMQNINNFAADIIKGKVKLMEDELSQL